MDALSALFNKTPTGQRTAATQKASGNTDPSFLEKIFMASKPGARYYGVKQAQASQDLMNSALAQMGFGEQGSNSGQIIRGNENPALKALAAMAGGGDTNAFNTLITHQLTQGQPQTSVGKIRAAQQSGELTPEEADAMIAQETAPTKTQLTANTAEKSKSKFDEVLRQIQGGFTALDEAGGMTDPAKTLGMGTLDNIADYVANTSVGQIGGKALSTPQQAIRNDIEAKKQMLVSLYKQASGTTGGQMNSDTELQNFLKALPSLTNDLKSNEEIIKGLSQTYGAGGIGGETPNLQQLADSIIMPASEFSAASPAMPVPVPPTSLPSVEQEVKKLGDTEYIKVGGKWYKR
jgi:hypothetical protein